MKSTAILTGTLSLSFCLLCANIVQAAEVGQIISFVPSVYVTRDGARTPLALNSPVQDTDTITTDASGRARILFHDDGAVTLGPDTSLALMEVLPKGDAPTFKAHVAQGLARFITGKIVEANPKGFAVSTPEATVGIRGTIFVLQTGNGQTTLYVINATRDVTMNDVSVPGGFKMTLPGGSPVPMTPEDFATIQTAAVAPSSAPASAASEQEIAASLDAGDLLAPSKLTDLGLATQSLGDAMQKGDFVVTVSGASIPAGFGFGFEVGLQDGAIQNGWLNGNTSYLIMELSNGRGSYNASSGSYLVNGFSGTYNFIGTTPFAGETAGVSYSAGSGTNLSGNLANLDSGTPTTGGQFTLYDSSNTNFVTDNLNGQVQ
jgi:hypothetical protein